MSELTDNDVQRVTNRLQSAQRDAESLIQQLQIETKDAERARQEAEERANHLSNELTKTQGHWNEAELQKTEERQAREQTKQEKANLVAEAQEYWAPRLEIEQSAREDAEADAAQYKKALQYLFDCIPSVVLNPEEYGELCSAAHAAYTLLQGDHPEHHSRSAERTPQAEGEDGATCNERLQDGEPNTAEQAPQYETKR